MPLRAKVVLPLLVISLLFAFLLSSIVLASLEQNLASDISEQLRMDLQVLASFLSDDISDLSVLGPTEPFPPGRLIIWFSEDGTRLYPLADNAGESASLPSQMSEVMDPSEFLQHEMVGIVDTVLDGKDRSVAILSSTRPYRHTYEEVRIRLIVACVVLVIVLMVLGNYIASRLTRRLERLRLYVREPESVDVEPNGAGTSDALGLLEQDIVTAQNGIRETRKEISRLQIVRSQFLANVSHEVRTPLFSLKGFLETLLDGGIDDPEVNRKFLAKALHHAQRIDNLLRDLIDITRIESGEMRMSFRYFRLSGLLDQIREDHTDLAHQRNQEFRVEGGTDDPEVMGDKDRLRQALSNLVENALKYSPPGSAVSVLARPLEESVAISVRDNGPGISKEHVSRIFERFYRIEPDRSRELGGTGLGLAIVKHIVEAHGSRVEVQSDQGKGTVFSFSIRR